MVLPCQEISWAHSGEQYDSPACWRSVQLTSSGEMPAAMEAVLSAMAAKGYLPKDIFGVHLALEEALVNAIKHGHQNDPDKKVEVRFRVLTDHVLLEIEDEGPGFDHYQVPDPTASIYRQRPGGRGLLLMRNYMTWMRFNERGNCVTLCKCPSEPLADYTLE